MRMLTNMILNEQDALGVRLFSDDYQLWLCAIEIAFVCRDKLCAGSTVDL